MVRTAVIYTMAKAEPYDEVRRIYKTDVTLVEKKKNIKVDQSYLVMLGGPFEKIGKENEVVGGRSQKVGSTNKR